MKPFSLFKKNRVKESPLQPEQGNWGKALQNVQSITEGFDKVAELTRQYQEAVSQGFDKIIILANQFSNGAVTLEKYLSTLYEQYTANEEQYKRLLHDLAVLADHYEQLIPNNQVFAPIFDQITHLLVAHNVKPYIPEEGKPADLKYCVIEVAVPSENKPPGLIVKVISKGYVWQTRVLLPAKVVATVEIVETPSPEVVTEKTVAEPQADTKTEVASPTSTKRKKMRNTKRKSDVEERN